MTIELVTTGVDTNTLSMRPLILTSANVIRHPEAGAINCAPLFATPGYDNDILLSLRTVSTSVLQQESVNLCGAAFLYRKEDPPTGLVAIVSIQLPSFPGG